VNVGSRKPCQKHGASFYWTLRPWTRRLVKSSERFIDVASQAALPFRPRLRSGSFVLSSSVRVRKFPPVVCAQKEILTAKVPPPPAFHVLWQPYSRRQRGGVFSVSKRKQLYRALNGNGRRAKLLGPEATTYDDDRAVLKASRDAPMMREWKSPCIILQFLFAAGKRHKHEDAHFVHSVSLEAEV
jgi:hypothetical protein